MIGNFSRFDTIHECDLQTDTALQPVERFV